MSGFTPEQRDAWRKRMALSPTSYSPKKGFVRNPCLRRGPNEPCLCGSGEKWKHCCKSSMPLYIPESELAEHLEMMSAMAGDR